MNLSERRTRGARHVPLRDAILGRLAEGDEYPLDYPLELEKHNDGSVTDEVITLINEGLVYVAVPLSQMDWDTCVMRVSSPMICMSKIPRARIIRRRQRPTRIARRRRVAARTVVPSPTPHLAARGAAGRVHFRCRGHLGQI